MEEKPRLLPDARSDEDRPEPFRFRQEIDRVDVEPAENCVDDACAGRKCSDHDPCDDDRRNEMRQVDDRLSSPLVDRVQDFIEHEGEQDRHREAEHQAERADDDGVLDCAQELGVREQGLEMLNSHPGAGGNSPEHRIVLECDLQSVHRLVEEQEEPDDHRRQHHIDLPFRPEMVGQPLHPLPPWPGRARRNCVPRGYRNFRHPASHGPPPRCSAPGRIPRRRPSPMPQEHGPRRFPRGAICRRGSRS